MVAKGSTLRKHQGLLASEAWRVSVKSGPSSLWSGEKSHCKSQAFFVSQKAPTRNRSFDCLQKHFASSFGPFPRFN